MKKSAAQSGQVLLIVLLVMVVGLTMGLSLASRSTTDVKISNQLEQSSRAFSAAEAGVEAALRGDTVTSGTLTANDSAYIFSTSPAGGNDQLLSLNTIYIADTFTVWLYPHDASGNLPTTFNPALDYGGSTIDVCWEKASGVPAARPNPAMEISVIYSDGSNIKVQRGAYDSSSASNGFTKISGAPARCSGYSYGQTISMPSLGGSGYLVAMRLRPFYSAANTAVVPQPGNILPSQGMNIVSTGTAADTTRKVTVLQSYPSLPAIFDYVLFSGTEVFK